MGDTTGLAVTGAASRSHPGLYGLQPGGARPSYMGANRIIIIRARVMGAMSLALRVGTVSLVPEGSPGAAPGARRGVGPCVMYISFQGAGSILNAFT